MFAITISMGISCSLDREMYVCLTQCQDFLFPRSFSVQCWIFLSIVFFEYGNSLGDPLLSCGYSLRYLWRDNLSCSEKYTNLILFFFSSQICALELLKSTSGSSKVQTSDTLMPVENPSAKRVMSGRLSVPWINLETSSDVRGSLDVLSLGIAVLLICDLGLFPLTVSIVPSFIFKERFRE